VWWPAIIAADPLSLRHIACQGQADIRLAAMNGENDPKPSHTVATNGPVYVAESAQTLVGLGAIPYAAVPFSMARGFADFDGKPYWPSLKQLIKLGTTRCGLSIADTRAALERVAGGVVDAMAEMRR